MSRGLAAITVEDWPSDQQLRLMSGHLDHIRESCSALRAMLDGSGTDGKTRQTPAKSTSTRRPGRPSPNASAFKPGSTLGFVAAVRGIAEKNVRDVPRLLRECPVTGEDRAFLLDRLWLLESAAKQLEEVVSGHISTEMHPTFERRSDSLGRTSAVVLDRARGICVEEAKESPSTRGGTYIVVFHLDADATITVGALGTFAFPAGFYGYVGSAFGPGGVRARTGRHRTPIKQRLRWHVDFLTPHVTAIAVWWTHDTARRECLWSAALAATPGFDCPAPEFGARDCRKAPALRIGTEVYRCPAHLYRSLEPPDVHDFARRLGRLVPDHAPMYRQQCSPEERDGIVLDPS